MGNVVDISNRYFAIVGDEGFTYTNSIGVVMEAFGKLNNVSIMELTNETMAYQYAVCAYVNRFMMRNFTYAVQPIIPLNLPLNCCYIDENFQAREGERQNTYFPGLPI